MSLRMRNFAAVLPFVLLGCTTGTFSKPESVTAAGVDLAAYSSFGLRSPSERGASADQPQSILEANIRDSIRTELIEKGYREGEAGADLLIGYEAVPYLREKSSSPVRIGVGVGSWGGSVGSAVDASIPVGREGVTTTRESRLTIRAVDPRSNREVWVGTTTGDFEQGLDAGLVEKAVADILEGFPARRR